MPASNETAAEEEQEENDHAQGPSAATAAAHDNGTALADDLGADGAQDDAAVAATVAPTHGDGSGLGANRTQVQASGAGEAGAGEESPIVSPAPTSLAPTPQVVTSAAPTPCDTHSPSSLPPTMNESEPHVHFTVAKEPEAYSPNWGGALLILVFALLVAIAARKLHRLRRKRPEMVSIPMDAYDPDYADDEAAMRVVADYPDDGSDEGAPSLRRKPKDFRA